MKALTIALIAERKQPADRRVALLPEQCRTLLQQHPGLTILVEPSTARAIDTAAYAEAGCTVTTDLSPANVLFGIKEVPIPYLLADKTYFIFSHTIKKQAHNRALFRAMAAQSITLIDYETLVDEAGQRTVAFGYYAGLVGAYNGLRGFGLQQGLYTLPTAEHCHDRPGMRAQLQNIALPPLKLVVTGRGRVAQGAIEVLEMAGLKRVTPAQLLNESFDQAVYAVLASSDYNRHREGQAFDSRLFYTTPEFFENGFLPYAQAADILMACNYWNPRAPKLFTAADAASSDFKIRFIADITCDIDGSIPTTVRASTIAEPFYSIDPATMTEHPLSADHIGVMAVDNLPCEMPEDASRHFGHMLMEHVLPRLLTGDDGMLARATLLQNGHLTDRYRYLADYLGQGVTV